MKTTWALACIAALPLAAAMAGPAGNWPQHRSDDAHSGMNAAEKVLSPSTVPNMRQL